MAPATPEQVGTDAREREKTATPCLSRSPGSEVSTESRLEDPRGRSLCFLAPARELASVARPRGLACAPVLPCVSAFFGSPPQSREPPERPAPPSGTGGSGVFWWLMETLTVTLCLRCPRSRCEAADSSLADPSPSGGCLLPVVHGGLAGAFWPFAAVTCHVCAPGLGETVLCTPPVRLQGVISVAFVYEEVPLDLLAGEGLLQPVHLLGAPVRALCPKHTRIQDWGTREQAPGGAGQQARPGSVAVATKGGASRLQGTPALGFGRLPQLTCLFPGNWGNTQGRARPPQSLGCGNQNHRHQGRAWARLHGTWGIV